MELVILSRKPFLAQIKLLNLKYLRCVLVLLDIQSFLSVEYCSYFIWFVLACMRVVAAGLKWLVATSDQKDVNFKILQSLLSTKSQSILAHNL